ncbi:MAG: 30S ribosomal protein S4 [Chloroflexi bacterium]|nr:30S ribosomal protein S4 [Chloroflexota bacterium]GIW12473.1 MAG: 30S ribosomal protein S4 [Dehalococcoidia bacterium]
MARYHGPVCRLCRRAGEKLFLKGERCFTPKCALERRNYPPGQAGPGRRRKLSERGIQLREKQKVRHAYGVLERQFRRYFAEASRRPGMTGLRLLEQLELRLDNVVYRLGLADSRKQARQLVLHGHFEVNGRKTDIPSMVLKPGMVVAVRANRRNREFFKLQAEKLAEKDVPAWLALDPATLSGRVLSVPSRAEMPQNLSEQAVVEYYSR